MPNTLYGGLTYSPYTQLARIAAEEAGQQVNMVWLTEAQKAEQAKSGENMTGKYPMLKTDEGCVHESVAIAKYFTYGHATLNGTNANEMAACDQWIQW
jgi:glutathione S-transferase